MKQLNKSAIHPSWSSIVDKSLTCMDPNYLNAITSHDNWLPGANNILNAFSIPLDETQYILFGESPYPRAQSANGYAFWDANVHALWSETGLSKQVNRATSLRNMIKMLLVAETKLSPSNCGQEYIAAVDKLEYVETIDELFQNLLNHGFLLLNASLVLSESSVRSDAKAWFPFMETLLNELHDKNTDITLVLFGKIAEAINHMDHAKTFKQLVAEHPYNISFIGNQAVLDFFKPLQLLKKGITKS